MGTVKVHRQIGIVGAVAFALLATASARAAQDPWRTLYFDPPTTWGTVVYGAVIPWEDITHDGTPDFLVWDLSHVGFYNGATSTLLRTVSPPGSTEVSLNDWERPDKEDMDGDGKADLLLKWRSATSPTIHLSTYSPVRDEFLHTWDFPDATGFRVSLSREIEDITGDGTPEVLVTDWSYTPSGQPSHCGGATVYSGRDGHLIRRLYSPSPTLNGNFGEAAATLDDLNYDGVRDFVIVESAASDPASTSTDVIHFYSGATLNLLRSLPGPIPKDGGLGAVLSLCRGLPDLNGDGIPEIVLGYTRWYYSSSGLPDDSSASYVISGADGKILALVGNIGTPDANPEFHLLFSDLFDLNLDGTPDFLLDPVSAVPLEEPYQSGPVIWVGNFRRERVASFPQNGNSLAYWTSTIPDVTGDGRPDVFISTLLADSPTRFQAQIWTLLPQTYLWPKEVDFGLRDPDHGPSATRTVTLGDQNIGPLIVQSVSIHGPDADSFILQNPVLPAIYGPMGSAGYAGGYVKWGSQDYLLQFDPDTDGEKRATLVIATNDPTSPVLNVSLYGLAKEIIPAERAVYLTGYTQYGVYGLIEIDPKTGDRRMLSSNTAGTGPLVGTLKGVLPIGYNTLLADMGDILARHFLVAVDAASGNRSSAPLETEWFFAGWSAGLGYGNLVYDRSGHILITDDQGLLDASRVLRIDSPSSATAVVVSSKYENVGAGPAFNSPWDIDVTRDGTILVTDTYSGLFRVDPVTGDREHIGLRTPAGDEVTNPLLNTAVGLDDSVYIITRSDSAIYRVDLATTTVLLFSGKGKGKGPDFAQLGALAVDPLDGALYAYDNVLRTLFRVDPVTGDRVVVSSSRAGAEVGEGVVFPQSAYFMAVSTRQYFQGKGWYLH